MKQAKCNKCGSEKVAWVQSRKSGNWYLAELQGSQPNLSDPHFKHCSGQEPVVEEQPVSRFNTFLHGELGDVDSLLEEECSEDEIRAALQNVIRHIRRAG